MTPQLNQILSGAFSFKAGDNTTRALYPIVWEVERRIEHGKRKKFWEVRGNC